MTLIQQSALIAVLNVKCSIFWLHFPKASLCHLCAFSTHIGCFHFITFPPHLKHTEKPLQNILCLKWPKRSFRKITGTGFNSLSRAHGGNWMELVMLSTSTWYIFMFIIGCCLFSFSCFTAITLYKQFAFLHCKKWKIFFFSFKHKLTSFLYIFFLLKTRLISLYCFASEVNVFWLFRYLYWNLIVRST